MFSKIFVETSCLAEEISKNIIKRFSSAQIVEIDKYDNYFEKVKKPYLQKREDLNLYIAKKKGKLVKEAPSAYGLAGEPHYYYVHAYNCIYECEYCYLQGYFSSPDLVLFINHDEIVQEMKQTLNKHPSEKVWFHAGEYSDSLALSHISGELPIYHEFAKKNPRSFIELRTKSANISELLKLKPLDNFIVSFSMSPEMDTKNYDLKTAPLSHRLGAIGKLYASGFKIGLHFDPIIYSENILEHYENLFSKVFSILPAREIQYISLGVVRFTEKVFHELKRNYPSSEILKQDFSKSFDNKIRYPKPFRMNLLGKLKDGMVKRGAIADQVYLCME